ncbi:MAG TPA: S26 family signal peptidase [Thermoplasmata archaeon]|nr:S26 family signal peptidase [Thermoplasmata archaeon]
MPDANDATALGRWARFARRLRSRRFRVADWSMEPTLVPDDRLYVDPGAYRHRSPVRGDLVVARETESPHRFFVKRVGFVSGELALPDGPRVPPGFVYLLGDNLALSRDSRRYGPVPIGSLVGRAYRLYLPAERRRKL